MVLEIVSLSPDLTWNTASKKENVCQRRGGIPNLHHSLFSFSFLIGFKLNSMAPGTLTQLPMSQNCPTASE
jgi:hypothetical protein